MLLPGAADTIRVLLKRMVAVDSDAVAAVVIEACVWYRNHRPLRGDRFYQL